MLVPSTRDQAVLIAESIDSAADLTPEQIAGFKKLYRLDDPRTVAELIISGEISLVTDEEINDFIERLKHRRINTRQDFDNAMGFLRGVTDEKQKARLRVVLPSLVKVEYFKNKFLAVLSGGKS